MQCDCHPKSDRSGWIWFLCWLTISTFLLSAWDAQAAETQQNSSAVQNPGAELWREVRQRNMDVTGRSQVQGMDTGVLINTQGQEWRLFRVEHLIPKAAIVLGGIIAIIVLFFLFRGKVLIDGGLSGKKLFRFTNYDRILHWSLAIIFLLLAATGLLLLFGRMVIIPLLGSEVFSTIAGLSKLAHNFVGPLFLVTVLLMLFRFFLKNIYAKGDLTWLLKGGGMIGKGHVTGGFFNMGEKTWYWIVILVGLLIAVTGLILDFPGYGQTREILSLSQVLHSLAAIILTAVSIGHMYLGSIGTEGTLEGMKTGYVDLNWARSHHDRWAKECEDKGAVFSEDDIKNKDV